MAKVKAKLKGWKPPVRKHGTALALVHLLQFRSIDFITQGMVTKMFPIHVHMVTKPFRSMADCNLAAGMWIASQA